MLEEVQIEWHPNSIYLQYSSLIFCTVVSLSEHLLIEVLGVLLDGALNIVLIRVGRQNKALAISIILTNHVIDHLLLVLVTLVAVLELFKQVLLY